MEKEYGSDLCNKIGFALMENPNITEVCKQFGISRRVFEEWRLIHDTFDRTVIGCLAVGRGRVSEKAEEELIKRIENGDPNAGKFWLSHNHERYIKEKEVRYFQYLERSEREQVSKESPDSRLEALLLYYYSVEEDIGVERAKKSMDAIVKFLCKQDPDLIAIFYSLYKDFKEEKQKRFKLMGKVKFHKYSWETGTQDPVLE